jgi:hypothetical protein
MTSHEYRISSNNIKLPNKNKRSNPVINGEYFSPISIVTAIPVLTVQLILNAITV